MSKRILVLDSLFQVPPDSSNKVVACSSPDEVLPILMGGSSAFGNENYLKTGKIRPEILVVDSTYLSTYEGLELFEIIRKYYTLRNVAIYISSNNKDSVDPALFKRYRIAGVIEKPYDLDSFTAPGSPPDEQSFFSPREGSMLGAIFLFPKDLFQFLGQKALKIKTVLGTAVKSVGAVKLAAISAGAAVTVAAVGLRPSEKAVSSAYDKKIIPVSAKAPLQEASLAPASRDTAAFVAEKRESQTPVLKRTASLPETEAVAEAVINKDTLSRQDPEPRIVQREAKIKVVEEEEGPQE